ncbi:MAG: class I SAM-dependent methyltransferase [Actinobacteria bacterium]|nr:class I SAM-dependent methyltransferase [Actinomycetota bacterium]
MSDLWERHAGWWQQEFTDGADPEYEEQILPLAVELTAGFARVLEVGTGEGQVARAIGSANTSMVIGIDPTTNQITEASRRGGVVAGYSQADAAALPFRSGAFDAVVTCLVLEHVPDVHQPISEMARVVRGGGRVVLLINHPLLQTPGSGWIDDHILDPPEQYWRVGPYLPEAETVEEVERGVHIRFFHRPLSHYVNAFAEHQLLIERMIEPRPPPGFVALAPEYPDAATIPRLLVLIGTKNLARHAQ